MNAAVLLLAACAVRPEGELAERDRLAAAGQPYAEDAVVPELPARPTVDDYVRVALLANADLRARYWEWRAAVEQIPQDSSPPNIALSFDYLLGGGGMSAWDRTTLGLTNDTMTNIPVPSKLATAGRRALELARAAGLRFEAARFRLQGSVRSTYSDLALLAETERIQAETVALLRQIAGQVAVRVQSGSAGTQDQLRAQTEIELAGNELQNLRARIPAVTARLDALLSRTADAPLPRPEALPAPRPLDVPDHELIRIGSERSPELAALARDVAGRDEALNLARQAWIPDFGLSFSLTGSISQMLGAMLVLPTRTEAIRAGIEQARAGLRAAEAARLQYERDLAASFVLNLAVLRNDERQVALFESTIVPRAQQTVQILLTSYPAQRASWLDLLDAQRTLLDARLALAQLRTEREKALAAIETWSAVDVEAFAPAGIRGAAGRAAGLAARGGM
ncbi:MAG: TolC family protein [Planctomycetota bacterium]